MSKPMFVEFSAAHAESIVTYLIDEWAAALLSKFATPRFSL